MANKTEQIKNRIKKNKKPIHKKFNIWDLEDPESAGMSLRDQEGMWQHLVDTGDAWRLQGWYGRNASALIKAGLIKPPKKKTTKNSVDFYGNKLW